MSSIKRLSFIYLGTVLLLGLWAAYHFRVEMVDGSQVLFHMMNSSPYQNYINHRSLGFILHYSAYLNPLLLDLGLGFKTIYTIHNFVIALNPFLIALITTLFLYKQHKSHQLIFYYIAFSLSVLATYSFHVSLVPESLLFGWLAFFCWQNSDSWLSYALGIPSSIFLNLGYESSCGFSVFIIFATLYLFLEKTIVKETFRSKFLKVSMSLLCIITIFIRLSNFEHFGVLEYSATKSMNSNYPEFFYIITSIIFLIIINLKNVNKLIAYSLLILSNTYIFLFFSIDEMQVFSGYNLRTIVFIPSLLCLCLMIFKDLKKTNYKKYLIPFCYITLVSFAINDIYLTKHWESFRAKRHLELSIYNKGCYLVDHADWEIPYYSINYQQSFKPSFIVIDNKDDSRCKLIDGQYKIVPKMYQYDRVKNYDFSLFLTK